MAQFLYCSLVLLFAGGPLCVLGGAKIVIARGGLETSDGPFEYHWSRWIWEVRNETKGV